MDLTDILIAKALFPGQDGGGTAEGGGGAKVAIWNGDADLTDGEIVKFSDETPTAEELRCGYLLLENLGKYYPIPLDGTVDNVTIYENQGSVAIMWGKEMGVLFAVAPEELEGITGMDSGIYRFSEYKTDFTEKPMILVW